MSFHAKAEGPSLKAETFDEAGKRIEQQMRELNQRTPSLTSAEIDAAAAETAKRAIITERLGGDERMFKRWASLNASYLKYRVGLTKAELDGNAASVRTVDAVLQASAELRKWRRMPGTMQTVISPSGLVMNVKQAKLLGYVEENQ